ncbi:MAG: hypothetical protein AUI83_08810 [Armatimonadetes bacterium 13_1_40CM_3_65_7]|nr:MAG: hypothetical protein AUI83_08810 [Armatimonadetes bacterium 13_1_40CM_3_65_7]
MSVPDLSQVDWAKVISLSFTVVPVVYRYRGVLAKITDVLAEAIGFSALVGGLYVYTQTLPEIPTAALQFKSDPSLSGAEHIQTLDLLYFCAISLMVLGGLLTVSGLLGRFQASVRDRLRAASQPKRR